MEEHQAVWLLVGLLCRCRHETADDRWRFADVSNARLELRCTRCFLGLKAASGGVALLHALVLRNDATMAYWSACAVSTASSKVMALSAREIELLCLPQAIASSACVMAGLAF